jgi:hypothetical protein
MQPPYQKRVRARAAALPDQVSFGSFMIPVVPAVLNAIHDATGHRFQSLPVTEAK